LLHAGLIVHFEIWQTLLITGTRRTGLCEKEGRAPCTEASCESMVTPQESPAVYIDFLQAVASQGHPDVLNMLVSHHTDQMVNEHLETSLCGKHSLWIMYMSVFTLQ
jgi:hypothetical protein